MNKNLFKLGYTALALVSMIALSRNSASAQSDASCGAAEGSCLMPCNYYGPASCYTNCYNAYYACEASIGQNQN